MKKKILHLMLCLGLCMTFCTALTAQATDYVQPRYSGISSFTTNLTISGGVAHCESTATGNISNTTVRLSMSLQRSADKNSWSTIYTCSAEGSAPILERNISVSSGYYYRLYCTTRVYNSSNTLVGSNNRYSSVRYY